MAGCQLPSNVCCSGATVPSLIDSGGPELWRNRRIASSTIWANPTMYPSQSTVQPSAKAVSRHKTKSPADSAGGPRNFNCFWTDISLPGGVGCRRCPGAG